MHDDQRGAPDWDNGSENAGLSGHDECPDVL